MYILRFNHIENIFPASLTLGINITYHGNEAIIAVES